MRAFYLIIEKIVADCCEFRLDPLVGLHLKINCNLVLDAVALAFQCVQKVYSNKNDFFSIYFRYTNKYVKRL